MRQPDFKVGDKVRFQVFAGNGRPRWSYDNETVLNPRNSWVWIEAEVLEVDEDRNLKTRHKRPDGSDTYWYWPLRRNFFYDPLQWYRPGYLAMAGDCGGCSSSNGSDCGGCNAGGGCSGDCDKCEDCSCGKHGCKKCVEKRKHKCTCEITVLMNGGCQCGGK